MDRAIPCGSKLCAQRIQQQRFQMHKERLRKVKSQVDSSEPVATQMEHVRTNLKREQMLEERYSEIDRANRILLQKMSEIMKQPPILTPRTERAPGPPSLNRDARKKELLRITRENQSILRRIQQAQPVYNHVEWEGLHRRNISYLKNCSEFPLVLRQTKRGNNASELVPLEGPRTARSATATPREEEKLGPDARCVFKDGARIGQSNFLVEMSTDGRVLVISAHDTNTRATLELVVKEKSHRRLYRDVNGDYSQIALRLRVEGNRLFLDEGLSSTLPLVSERATPRSAPLSARRQDGRTPEELDADAMVVLRDRTGSPGSVNAHIEVRSNGDAQVRLRGLTPSSG